MKRHIALIGFMGAGKTTVGERLARELRVPFIDTDALIVAQHGPIPAIFEREGEAGFRAHEHAALRAALAGPPAVVALGGGAVTHAPTRALVAESTLCVYLESTAAALAARLRRSKTPRPMLGGRVDIERIRELLAAREPLYRKADIVVDARRRSRSALAREIAELVRPRLEVPA